MLRKKICVIGIGDFGRAVVKGLYEEGHEVTAIDRDLETIEEIKDQCTHAVCLDSTDEKAMIAQNIHEMDVIILSSAESFETLIVTTDILKRNCSGELIVRYRTEVQRKVLSMIGVKNLFYPEKAAADSMAEQLSHQSIRRSMILSDQYRLVEAVAPRAYEGLPLLRTNLKKEYNLSIVTIKRAESDTNIVVKKGLPIKQTQDSILGIPDGDTIIREDDVLILFGKLDDIERFLNDMA
ncbi:MAG: TrkA family potassium uptake protein [Leptonema sp. (in: Bacteria)]|nr:TrkA family potassium uptake protein [Leptonema sp. (in: bacteria)]